MAGIGMNGTVVFARPKVVAPRLAIRAPAAIDGTGAPVRHDAILLVEAGKIIAFGSARDIGEIGSDWAVAEFPRHTLLPGLIDCHVHLMLVGDGRPLEAIIDETDDLLLLRSARNAAAHLAGGVTTVRDLGARHDVAFAVRDAARTEGVPSPRLLLSGPPITPPRGHCYFFGAECDGPAAARAAARRHLDRGADVIKVMATGGLTRGTGHHAPGLSADAMRAAVEEAHRAGVPTAAHTSSIQGMWNVLSAGVDCIEHAVFLDDQATLGYDAALADAIARAGLFVSPTLQEAFRGLAPLDAPDRLTEPSERQTLEALRERKWGNIRNAGRLHEAGVRLIAGSDAGSRVTPHGDLAFGVELLARAGLTNAEALHAATGLAADACGIAADVGTLQPGRIADLLIVEGDVTADIRAVANVRAVFQAGRLAAERTS